MRFEPAAVIEVAPQDCRTYAEGWQSWSPTRVWAFGETVPVPTAANTLALGYRADRPPGPAPQGEGLLAVQHGEVTDVFYGSDLPSIRAIPAGGRVRIEADGPVERTVLPGRLPDVLGRWAGQRLPVAGLRPAPTVWCSWYQYFTDVTQADIEENLQAMTDLDVPVDVVQIDDGYQREIGDWLTLSDRFSSLPDIAARIASHGRRAGIWVAPFLVGERAEVARRHPEWLLPGGWAGRNWGQDLRALDVRQDGAADYLLEVFAQLRAIGFDYFKIDFCYAGALAGLDAYREGLRIIRRAIGAAYLVGCGAPTLASVGLVDAMRIGPDTAAHVEPTDGDPSQPGQRGAIANGVARAWQHGRFWVNDPDCLLVRPGIQQREVWAGHVQRFGGVRASSDRLRDLDGWGLETTRRLLGDPPAAVPFG